MPEAQYRIRQLRAAPSIPIVRIDAVVAANLGPARVRGNAHPHVLYRQIAMYLCKHVGGWSTTQIGRFYNGRDHSTVTYAIRRIESLRASDAAFDALICTLIEQCRTAQEHRPSTGTQSVQRQIVHSPIMLDLVDTIAELVMKRLQTGRPMVPDQPYRKPPGP